MMKRSAIALFLVLVLFARPARHSRPPVIETPTPCLWTDQSSAPLADSNNHYWATNIRADPEVTLTISGTYPADRYTSYQAYSTPQSPFGGLLDTDLVPDVGSLNPFLVGTTRGQGTYTAHIVAAPAPAQPLSNTIYADLPPSTTIVLWYRVYLPDARASPSGDVALPVISAQDSTTGQPVPCPLPVHPFPPATPGTTPPAGAFHRLRTAFFSSQDAAYLAATLPPSNTLYVVRFRGPTTPHTLGGGIADLTAQLRYWSLCVYNSKTRQPLACMPDEAMPKDQNAQITVVLGPTAARPANATTENGVQWIDLGSAADSTELMIRHVLPSPAFGMSAFVVPIDATPGPEMGPYAPILAQCGTLQFEDDECIPGTSTPSPPTATPTSAPAILSGSPTHGPFHTLVIVTGDRFGLNEPIGIFWDSRANPPLGSAISSAGSFQATVAIPQAISGKHTFIAIGQESHWVATLSFVVNPLLVVRPSHGAVGTAVAALGTGFDPIESVEVHWNSTSGPLLGTTTSNSLGTIGGTAAMTFTVPAAPPGTYSIVGIGTTSGVTGTTRLKIP